MIFLGVDGGGTKTRFLAVDEEVQVVLDVTLGSSYLPAVGEEGLKALFQEALSFLPEPPARTVLGLGGYGEATSWDEAYHRAVASVFPHYRILNDVVLAYLGAFEKGDGVLVLAGTGSMAYGRGPRGEGRAGGFGPLFGDEGSAYWIGVRALNRASRAEDGRDPPTRLQELPQAMGKGSLTELLAWLGENPAQLRSRVAGLAQRVDALALEDPAAEAILQEAARELFLLGKVLAQRLGARRLAYGGGVFRSITVKRVFTELAQREGLSVSPSFREPAWQAAYMALLGGEWYD